MNKKNKVKVSIIVPVYNAERYIKRLLDSILNQTMPNYEIILVNDGSTDASESILEEYAKKDKRIVLVNVQNGGVSKARNIGLSKTTGEYVTFIDADDYIENDLIETLYEKAIQTNCDIVITGYYIVSQKNKIRMFDNCEEKLSNDMAMEELIRNRKIGMSVWAKLFKRNIISSLKFDENYKNYEDRLFVFEAIRNSQNVLIIPNTLYNYCMNRDSVTHSDFNLSRVKGLEVMDKMYKIVSREYPHLERCSYADVIRMKYVTLCSMYERRQWKKFKNEHSKLVLDIKNASLKKLKNYVFKTTYYQLCAIKYAEPIYRYIKEFIIKIKSKE